VIPTTSPLKPVSSFSSLKAAVSALSPSSINPEHSRATQKKKKKKNQKSTKEPDVSETEKQETMRISLSRFRPAGNSSVWHPIGGRNCFTITTQSLCSVCFSRAMIPTPAGGTSYRPGDSLRARLNRYNIKYTKYIQIPEDMSKLAYL